MEKTKVKTERKFSLDLFLKIFFIASMVGFGVWLIVGIVLACVSPNVDPRILYVFSGNIPFQILLKPWHMQFAVILIPVLMVLRQFIHHFHFWFSIHLLGFVQDHFKVMWVGRSLLHNFRQIRCLFLVLFCIIWSIWQLLCM